MRPFVEVENPMVLPPYEPDEPNLTFCECCHDVIFDDAFEDDEYETLCLSCLMRNHRKEWWD